MNPCHDDSKNRLKALASVRNVTVASDDLVASQVEVSAGTNKFEKAVHLVYTRYEKVIVRAYLLNMNSF
jgi:hypothetical protein